MLSRYFLKIRFCALVVFLGACSTQPRPSERPLDLPFTRIYEADYESVWNAAVDILDVYTIIGANKESGILETEWSESRFNPETYEHPDKEDRLEEVKYRLKIKFSKGFVSQSGKPATRVQISKELMEYKNFFTDWKRSPTDHYEENVLLYRIEQKLKIQRKIKVLMKEKKRHIKKAEDSGEEGHKTGSNSLKNTPKEENKKTEESSLNPYLEDDQSSQVTPDSEESPQAQPEIKKKEKPPALLKPAS